MTDNDTRRIHQRLDEIVCAIGDQAVSIAKMQSSFDSMIAAAAKAEVTRAQTCPHNDLLHSVHNRITRMESAIHTLKWGGGIVTVALLIPGLRWFGSQLWTLVLGL